MIALKRIALHPLARITLFFVLISASHFLLLPISYHTIVFRVASVLVVFLITAALLKTENLSLQSIGVHLKVKSLKYLLLGSITGIEMLAVVALLTQGIVGFQWQLNSLASLTGILMLLSYYFWSAILEELVFRGYGFQRLAQFKGKWVALFSVGILFGLFHVNDSMPMPVILMTMLNTGLGHVFFGLAVLKTNNLALPIGLHFGWNAAQGLMPRHPSQNAESSIWHIVPSDGMDFPALSLLVPYLIIIITGCLFFLFYKK